MGVRDKPTAPRSPRQNPYVERLIGTIRRECLDHMIVFGGRTCAGFWVGMPRIIMNRAFIGRWTRMPHSTGRLSASASSHHSLSSAVFITNIAESDFRHAQASRRLFCAVGAIAGISQTWDNEPSLIESIVDSRSPKTNIGMKPTHPLHSFLSGNQTDETDILGSAFLDTINGGSGCITGRQHRRHDDHEPLPKVGRSFEKIFDCDECIGITVKPDMRDTCSRHEIEHAFHECHAGPKNWRKNKLLSSDSRR